jgi:hypothetical protein
MEIVNEVLNVKIENPCKLKNPDVAMKIGELLLIEGEQVSKALRFLSR